MENVSARMKLLGNLQAVATELLADMMRERGRGFASDKEAWAELKSYIESTNSTAKDIEKLHKEMWGAVKDRNGDAYRVLAQEFERSASRMAAEWTTAAVAAKIAMEMTDD